MNVNETVDLLRQSMQALEKHRAQIHAQIGVHGDQTRVELRHARPAAGLLHLQLWWVNVPSQVAHEFMWDTLDVQLDRPEDGAAILDSLRTGLQGVSMSSVAANPPTWPRASEVPEFAFHPLRYRALHPLGKRMAQLGQDAVRTAFTNTTVQAAAGAVLAAEHEAMGRTALRYSIANSDRRHTNDTIELAVFFADYCGAGRQVFAFPPRMVEMFARTEVTDIPLDAIRLPYRTIYLAFGAQPTLKLPEGWLADGAYVSMLGESPTIQFALTFAPTNRDLYPRWIENPEPVYIQSMNEEMMKIGVGEATDRVLAEKLAQLRKQVSSGSIDTRIKGVTDSTPHFASVEMERLPVLHQVWSEALKLVVNAVAYLSAYPEDVDRRWPEDTPQRLYLQTQDGTPNQKRKATSQLASMGYSEINYCGRCLAKMPQHPTASNADASSREATWVRGHWLRQAYGPAHSLRKLQWRMPVLRNAREAQTEALGHIYQVIAPEQG